MRRRPGPATWRESRRFRQAHQKLGYVGRGVVDRIVYDLGEKVDALVSFVIVTTRGLRMARHAEGQSVAKPRGRATRPARPSVSVCKPRGSRDDAPG
jgi:hypothetical protein